MILITKSLFYVNTNHDQIWFNIKNQVIFMFIQNNKYDRNNKNKLLMKLNSNLFRHLPEMYMFDNLNYTIYQYYYQKWYYDYLIIKANHNLKKNQYYD
jgi:hypothetical protein